MIYTHLKLQNFNNKLTISIKKYKVYIDYLMISV